LSPVVNINRMAARIIRQPVWYLGRATGTVYLTFDDGPTASLTGWILDVLESFGARATFFCTGRRAELLPDVYRSILEAGHSAGNHTYTHLRGWSASTRRYLEDVRRAEELIASGLFRPPYGQLFPRQIHALAGDYRIIMWDVLSRDYDPRQLPRMIMRRLKKRVQPGSIVVFHDSPKAEKNLRAVLPAFLAYCRDEGYRVERMEGNR